MSEEVSEQIPARGWLGPVRLALGLGQGIGLFALHRCWDFKEWPASQPPVFWALVLFAASWPLILLAGLGAARRSTLVAWSAAGGVVILSLGFYDVWRQAADGAPVNPSGQVILAIAAALFVGHHLVVAGDAAGRWIAPYPKYFDVAWKDAVQLGLAALFVGVFWLLLWLGAELFKLIGISAFQTLIQKDWFSYPATGMVFAWAVHLTDASANLTRGARTILLALLSWLMPLMAAIVAAFLIAIPFTGLGPLWRTHAAANVLLAAAAALIVLVNAAYHDGTVDRRPVVALQWAGRVAAVLIAPLVLIAAYGILLRVHQHGWSPQRIVALACTIVGMCYGGGYSVAAVRAGPWLKPLERTNVFTAFVVLAVILALFSPVADPARISVADQLSRLEGGRTPVAGFDFRFLRFSGERFGREALRMLQERKSGPNAALISRKAAEAQRLEFAWDAPAALPAPMSGIVQVYPKGKTLPPSFVGQRWEQHDSSLLVGPCVANAERCDGFLLDMDGDGVDEVLLADDTSIWVYKVGPGGKWAPLGTLDEMTPQVRNSLRAGTFAAVASPWKDLQAGQKRLRFSPAAAIRTPRLRPMTVFIR